ncbi:uncharacterized protein LOC132790728 [Drosophila nasuta]|uniref:Uncharacterized protein LOC117569197 n=1 Tax=Drosophila albomicans TaxID=7291 RepID=A0A6P8WQX5_DROAB|nr:uncharacterized protein LOC117569197 [Drosophila albomicans]XP_060655356.1 uncharacterized protein LOC132790728 [Drosophila nasuta]
MFAGRLIVILLVSYINNGDAVTYTSLHQSCEGRTTPEMHEKCGIYTFYKMKPLLLDLGELQAKLLTAENENKELQKDVSGLQAKNQELASSVIQNVKRISDLESEIDRQKVNNKLQIERQRTLQRENSNLEAEIKNLEENFRKYKQNGPWFSI